MFDYQWMDPVSYISKQMEKKKDLHLYTGFVLLNGNYRHKEVDDGNQMKVNNYA